MERVARGGLSIERGGFLGWNFISLFMHTFIYAAVC